MRIAIVDTNYTDQKFQGLAATWLRWEAQRAGVDVVIAENADVILMTVSSQQGCAQVRSWRKNMPQKTPIVLGGGGCWGPAVFDGMADAICVGEGQRFTQALFAGGIDAVRGLPETWITGENRAVIPGDSFPWDCPPLNHPDGTVRVWGARGCRRKCLFCQTGWEQAFHANPFPSRTERQILALRKAGRKVAVITNDGAADDYGDALGQQEFVSVTAAQAMKLKLTRAYAKSIRIGVEGVSERMRRAAGKPIATSDLAELTIRAWREGVGVRWFFVAGLPGETDADWIELRDLVDRIRHEKKGVVMANFHAFIPQPATPLCVLPVVDEYWDRFEEFRRWFFHGPGFTRRMQIVAPAQYKGRMRRACESMAATEAEIRRGWFSHDNGNWRVKYLLNPDQMRKSAAAYTRKLNA